MCSWEREESFQLIPNIFDMSPNLTRTWFLKVSPNVDSESIPMNFFVLYYSKIGLLPMQDFVTSRFGSFWKY